jgi:predicted small secreted protein
MRLVIAVLLGGLVVTACATAGGMSDGSVVRWVGKTVAERQATAEDKHFDEIGWVTDIRTAIQLGKEYNRPIFLYTGDGRINTGRC